MQVHGEHEQSALFPAGQTGGVLSLHVVPAVIAAGHPAGVAEQYAGGAVSSHPLAPQVPDVRHSSSG